MQSNNSNGWLLATVCLGVAAVITWVDFGLYISRVHDNVGIGLNAVMAIVFTFAAAGFYIQWRKTRNKSQE